MSNLIDRELAIDALNKSHFPGAPYVDAGISITIGEILDLPSADVPDKKVGEWRKEDRGGVEYTAVCSECGYGTFWSEAETYNFCPMCGSEMRGDKDEQLD